MGLGRMGVRGACLLWFRDASFSPAPQWHARPPSYDGHGPHPDAAPEFRRHRLRYRRSQRVVGVTHSLAGDVRKAVVPFGDRSRRPSHALHGVTDLRQPVRSLPRIPVVDLSTHTFGGSVELRPDQLDLAKIGRFVNLIRPT